MEKFRQKSLCIIPLNKKPGRKLLEQISGRCQRAFRQTIDPFQQLQKRKFLKLLNPPAAPATRLSQQIRTGRRKANRRGESYCRKAIPISFEVGKTKGKLIAGKRIFNFEIECSHGFFPHFTGAGGCSRLNCC